MGVGFTKAAALRRERAEKIAMFRYQLIRGAADEGVTKRERGVLIRQLAAEHHASPFGGTVKVSRETLDRWVKAWRTGGFEALKPSPRAQGPQTPQEVLGLAASLKRERPARTAAQVRRILVDTLGSAPSESTLLRHFRSLNIRTGAIPEATGRFEADYVNEIWVGDGLHGPRIGGRKTYLFAFLDDHSRLATCARWAYAEDSVRLSAVLRPALESRGIPGTIYVDNGSAFADESLARTCARLGIKLTHSEPYRPQGRGKIERFFNTVNSQFLTEITVADGEEPADSVGSRISSIDELNRLFTAWIEMVYHHNTHSTTKETPLTRWGRGVVTRPLVMKDPAVIAEAFLWSVHRRASKSATVSLHSNTYQVDPMLAGCRIELVYDPFNLADSVTVPAHPGVPEHAATLLDVKRHVHPKAVNAVRDQDAHTPHPGTGIDYLRMVEERHTQAMPGTPIQFTTITGDHTPPPSHGIADMEGN